MRPLYWIALFCAAALTVGACPTQKIELNQPDALLQMDPLFSGLNVYAPAVLE